MPFLPQSDDYGADRIIADFKSIEKIEEQLKFVLLQLYSLPMDKQKTFRNQIIQFEKMFVNQKYMRKIRHRDAMIEENSQEYFGKDYGEDDPFLYNPKLEESITRLSMKLLATIGLIVKSMKENIFSVDDNA